MTDTDEAERPWRRRARRLTTLWPTMAVGAMFWVLLWGDLSWANVLSGMTLGALVAVAFPLPPFGTAATLRPGPLLRLAGRFVADLVLASFQVAWSALTPGPTPEGGLVSVRLRTESDLFVATIAGLSSMVPGTLVVDHDQSSRTLRLHVLDLVGSGGADAVRKSTLALEARLLRAFASHDELVRVGLVDPFGRPAPTPGKEVQR
jgi:multicomponent Na+:H+ antiporter subunit E